MNATNGELPKTGQAVHKIEIIALSDGNVQAATTADPLATMQMLGIAMAKLADVFAQKGKQKSPIVLPPGMPPPANLRS